MPYLEKTVHSVPELVQEVLAVNAGSGAEIPLWHRGHSCTEHRLVSSLARKVEDVENLLPLEQRLITRFRQRSLPFWPAGYPQNDWEQLFAMQHHGLPTRLLDWSENLFVALYFATSNVSHDGEMHEDSECFPVVWTLNPVAWNRQASQLQGFSDVAILTTDSEDLKAYAPITPGTDLSRRYSQPLAIYGTYNSARMFAQRGSFTVGGHSVNDMESYADDHAEQTLSKYTIQRSRTELQQDLAGLGFAESMIFPDLVGVSKEIAALEGLA